jgi:hypothetical protein
VKNRILSISLAIVLALTVGLIACGGEEVPEITEYNLTISSTEGGSVTTPGEGTFTYDEGADVNLVAKADEGYEFVTWTGDVADVADTEDSTTTIMMKNDCSITANFAVKQYSLVIHSTEGGSVTTPGENAYTYDKGEVVNLAAVADEGYQFINWTGDVSTVGDVNAASTSITMNGGYSITANFVGVIRDWYDLAAIINNVDGSYVLMNDLDSASPGYWGVASTTANYGMGWQPIGAPHNPFTGSLDGQGYEIRDVFIDRPNEGGVGLFKYVGVSGVVKDIDMVNITVTGWYAVGSLVGWNDGTVSDSYAAGMVSGYLWVGGLVGSNEWGGHVSNSCSASSVTGNTHVGGLVGVNSGLGIVSNSYSAGRVTGIECVGGLVGSNGDDGAVSNCYSTGTVTGDTHVGGLIGHSYFETGEGTVSDSFWDTQTSGQATSDGGIAKTTAETKSIATFSGAGWNIAAVANPGTRNPACIWNIVDGQTYPLLSWEPV